MQRTERELAGPGRPGTADRLVAKGGAPGGAAPYVTGRARCLAARGGYVNPASKGATSLHPGASRRSTPSRGSRGTGKPRTHCAARTRECGCLKIELELERSAFLTSPRSFAGRGRRASSDARRVRGQALRRPNEKTIGPERSSTHFADPRFLHRVRVTASPLTRSLRCASASTSPRKSGARSRKRRAAPRPGHEEL